MSLRTSVAGRERTRRGSSTGRQTTGVGLPGPLRPLRPPGLLRPGLPRSVLPSRWTLRCRGARPRHRVWPGLGCRRRPVPGLGRLPELDRGLESGRGRNPDRGLSPNRCRGLGRCTGRGRWRRQPDGSAAARRQPPPSRRTPPSTHRRPPRSSRWRNWRPACWPASDSPPLRLPSRPLLRPCRWSSLPVGPPLPTLRCPNSRPDCSPDSACPPPSSRSAPAGPATRELRPRASRSSDPRFPSPWLRPRREPTNFRPTVTPIHPGSPAQALPPPPPKRRSTSSSPARTDEPLGRPLAPPARKTGDGAEMTPLALRPDRPNPRPT